MLNKFVKETTNIVTEYERLIGTNYLEAKRLLEEINKIDNFERYLFLDNFGVDRQALRESYFIAYTQRAEPTKETDKKPKKELRNKK